VTRAAWTVAGLMVLGCSRGTEGAPAPVASASSAPVASASAAPSAKPASDGSGAWTGTYAATTGSLFVPDWTGVKFRGEDASVGLGEGAMNVTLDASGRATGTLDGALGAITIDGVLREAAFSATLVAVDRAKGFSGTAIGTRDGDAITGTMRLSLPTGNVIREATFKLAPTKQAKN
jgi:hypothetical protein